MRFKKFLCEQQQQEQDAFWENAIADYIYNLIEKSVKEYFAKGKKTKLSQIIAATSGGSAKNLGSISQPEMAVEFSIPANLNGKQLPQNFVAKNIKVRIRPARKSGANAEYGGGLMSIYLNDQVFVSAQNAQDQSVLQMLMTLEQRVHHESTHCNWNC